jgi:hypothetical protein
LGIKRGPSSLAGGQRCPARLGREAKSTTGWVPIRKPSRGGSHAAGLPGMGARPASSQIGAWCLIVKKVTISALFSILPHLPCRSQDSEKLHILTCPLPIVPSSKLADSGRAPMRSAPALNPISTSARLALPSGWRRSVSQTPQPNKPRLFSRKTIPKAIRTRGPGWPPLQARLSLVSLPSGCARVKPRQKQ